MSAYLGLGSNVGERREHLEAAVAALPAHGVTPLAASSVYETEPVGEVLDQPDFLNACLRVGTGLDPEALLDACKAVERELGRPPGGRRHAPRPIDIDVLLMDDRVHESARLRVPHRDLAGRRFVLVPLLELDPDVQIPGVGRAADALAALGPGQEVRRAGPPLALPVGLARGARPAATRRAGRPPACCRGSRGTRAPRSARRGGPPAAAGRRRRSPAAPGSTRSEGRRR